jgi:hypothetical protein
MKLPISPFQMTCSSLNLTLGRKKPPLPIMGTYPDALLGCALCCWPVLVFLLQSRVLLVVTAVVSCLQLRFLLGCYLHRILEKRAAFYGIAVVINPAFRSQLNVAAMNTQLAEGIFQ